VVVGAGVNGLVAAVLLAKAGWQVVAVDRNDEPGGALATEELTMPGYRHDTFASWHGTFVNGAAWSLLRNDLEARGLRYRAASRAVTATVRRDGSSVVLYRDPGRTADLMTSDGPAYLQELAVLRRVAPAVAAVLGGEATPRSFLRAALRLAAARSPHAVAWLARQGLSSVRSWAGRTFPGSDVDALAAPWVLHAGLTPWDATGALTAMFMLDGLHRAGLPVAEGGSRRLVDALVATLIDHGGRLLTGTEVTEIVVRGGRAVGVRTAATEISARRAVLASVTPSSLYGRLLAGAGAVPAPVKGDAGRFRHGRAAMQLHIALSEPLQWLDPSLRSVPLVHLADGSDGVALACAQAQAGQLPSRPTVVVGQQHVLDPTRVPPGGAALWIQLQETPSRPTGDSAGQIPSRAFAGDWSDEVVRSYVERVVALVSEHAPNLPAARLATSVLAPPDLARRNPNFVDGDPYGGATTVDQMLLWRPVPSLRGHRTPVDRLWHIGASTHPGPGLAAGSGTAAALALLGGQRRFRHGAASRRNPAVA
jgi:phytoene dehydrogenase-like protein